MHNNELTLLDFETIHDEIVKITPKGIMTATGREVEIDIIACATGFHVSYTPHLFVLVSISVTDELNF